MNTLFPIENDQPALFDTAPNSVTSLYADGGIMLALDASLDRQQIKSFCRQVIGIRGIAAAKLINQTDGNTSILLTLDPTVPNIAAKLEGIRRDAYTLADTFIKTTPVQSSLF